MRDWIQLINEASSKFGKEFNIAPQLKKLMTDTGWVDVGQKIVHVSLFSHIGVSFSLERC